MTGHPPARLTPVLLPDTLLAVLVAAVMVIGSGVSLEDDFQLLVPADGAGSWLPDGGGILLVLAGSLPLALRRMAPLTVAAVVGAASIAYPALGYRPEPLPLGVLVALYTLAVVRRPSMVSATAVVYVTTLGVGALLGWTPLEDDQFYVDLVAVVATVTLGYGVALSRARATLAERRAAELARDQDARMHAAVEQEQARIAREVHDIVAHDVSVMVAQAAAARRVFDRQPDAAMIALTSVETLGRDALDGVRRLVNLLRTADEGDERSPQPTLERLPSLVEQVRRAGHPVELTVTGRPRPLPATVELNAFRIVQEALTNSLKHAGAGPSRVRVDYGEDALRMDVHDRDGGGPNGDLRHLSARYGLISMQQRAALLGGDLAAGRDEDGGFRVRARLPLPKAAR